MNMNPSTAAAVAALITSTAVTAAKMESKLRAADTQKVSENEIIELGAIIDHNEDMIASFLGAESSWES